MDERARLTASASSRFYPETGPGGGFTAGPLCSKAIGSLRRILIATSPEFTAD